MVAELLDSERRWAKLPRSVPAVRGKADNSVRPKLFRAFRLPDEAGVSRYFKYKTGESLIADAELLGVEAHVRLADDASPLFQTATIASRRVGNRLAIHPMEGCDALPDGSPGELTLRRFRRFGAGGAKLIWG